MKKQKLFLLLISLLVAFTLLSCSNTTTKDKITVENEKQEENISENEVAKEEIPKTPTSFEALGKSYSSTKDLSIIEKGTNIYDDQSSIHYTPGEYKELDFANDLLYAYVNQDNSIYNYLVSYDSTNANGISSITEADKSKLEKDLTSLRSQMGLANGEEMVLRLDRVTYEGPSTKTNSGSTFKIRVAISRVGATIVPWNYFTVTVFEDGNKLFAHLF